MSRASRIGLLVLAALGCGSPAPKNGSDYTGLRFTAAADHFSMRPLDGWTQRRERGSVVFQATAPGLERNTIAIRAVPMEAGGGDLRAPEVVLAATEKTLQGLPDARVSIGQPLDRTDFRGLLFDLTFRAAGAVTPQYERRHVVLIGEHFIFHVFLTAPVGALVGTAADFAAVVDSFREEV